MCCGFCLCRGIALHCVSCHPPYVIKCIRKGESRGWVDHWCDRDTARFLTARHGDDRGGPRRHEQPVLVPPQDGVPSITPRQCRWQRLSRQYNTIPSAGFCVVVASNAYDGDGNAHLLHVSAHVGYGCVRPRGHRGPKRVASSDDQALAVHERLATELPAATKRT